MLPATGEPAVRPRPGGALVRTRVALFVATLLSALVVVLGMGAGPAQAEGESIFGFLFQTKAGERVAYEGVKVSATGPGGFKGEATSDETGRWTIEVPGKGTYTLKLDTETLPKGVNLTDESKQTLKVPVLVGQDKPVIFPLGKSTRQVSSKWTQAAQLTAEGLRFGLIIALASVGLSLIFGTTGLTNFAHGELVTLGALLTWWLSTGTVPFLPDFGGLQFFPAAAIALIICGLFGWANDAWLWKPLRRRGTGLIAAMIVSIGLGIFLRYFYLYLFTGNTQQFPDYQGAKGHRDRSDQPGRRRLLVDGRSARRADGHHPRPDQDPDRQGDPGRRRTTRRWPPPPASTSTRSSGWSGSPARSSPGWPASCSAWPRASTSRWASRSCC